MASYKSQTTSLVNKASSYLPSKESTNYMRLCHLIITICTDVMRCVLDKYIPPSDLPSALRKNIWILKQCPLNKEQKALLYPKGRSAKVISSKQLDISLLYILLRNISGIKEHRRGWGKDPESSDKSLSACIENIRLFKNLLNGHSVCAEVSDKEFKDMWSKLRSIVDVIEANELSGTSFVQNIDELLKANLDPMKSAEYAEKVNRMRLEEYEIKEMIHSLRRKVETESNSVHARLKAMEGKLMRLTPNREREKRMKIPEGKYSAKCKDDSTHKLKTDTKQEKTMKKKIVNDSKTNLVKSLLSLSTSIVLNFNIKLTTHTEQVKSIMKKAVNDQKTDMAKSLLSSSTLTEERDHDFLKELVVSAVYSKSLSVLRCLLDKLLKLTRCEYQMIYKTNEKPDSCSLLHHAAKAGSKEIVEFLVHSGLDVKQRTSGQERTILGFAASEGHLNVVDALLSICVVDDILCLGADPIVSSGAGGSVEIFNRLVNVGFSPNQKNKNDQTALHMALKNVKEEFVFYIMTECRVLIHMSGKSSRTSLHYAAQGGSVNLLRRLIDIGLDATCKDEDGLTILHVACLASKTDAVMYLTENHKCLLHIKDKRGRTVLHCASQGGNVDIFKHLVSVGLNTHDYDNTMSNMLHHACRFTNHDMIDYLLQHYGDDMIQQGKGGWYPFHFAAQFGDEAVFRLFLKYNVDICKLTSKGLSVLHITCLTSIASKFEMTRFILTRFPKLIPIKHCYGKTALETAVETGAVDIVRLF